MKKIPYLFILLLCLFVTTTSCEDEPLEGEFFSTGDGSDPEDDIPTENTDNMFMASVDGETYAPNSIQGQLITITGFSTISINTNNNTTGQNMSLTLPPDITPGEYSFDFVPDTDSIIGQYIPNINDPATESFSSISTDSMLTITAHDTINNIIEGTFSFTAQPLVNINGMEPIEITEGTFSVVYE